MKIGDLVCMPGETILPGEKPSLGIIIDDDWRNHPGKGKKRIGVMWTDSWRVDWEPKAWLEVVNG